MQERQRVAHRAYLSEVCSGGNRCMDCHTHSPSKFGEENSGMRVLESPLQIIKTGGVQEWFCFCFVLFFIFKLRILPNVSKCLWLKCSRRTQCSGCQVVSFTSANPRRHMESLRIFHKLLRTKGENFIQKHKGHMEKLKTRMQRILPQVAKLVTFQVYRDGSK